MRAKVDPDLCTGCELCTQTCPEVFQMEGDVAKAIDGEIPSAYESCTKQAAEECPVEAISLE